jgi:tRNA (cmo5U34)-methyltransferase
MSASTASYRWNTSSAAEAYDQAAPVIHPQYVEVQDQILGRLPFAASEPFTAVDLGGGSGRLAERILQRFTAATVTVVDQSEPFLALAERRLKPFAPRAAFVQCRLQDWSPRGRVSPRLDNRISERCDHVDVIVSTSAIHHLEPVEKHSLYEKCFAALAPGGLFINGDEFRPESDAELRALLNEWSAHMSSAIDEGRIPDSFRATLDFWKDRNISRFHEPKKSGDDCHETAATQVGYLKAAGFREAELMWSAKLWGVLVARKSGN